MEKYNKKLILIAFTVFMILLLSGVTYAWFKWRSSDNANVKIVIDNSIGLTVTFNGGTAVSGTLEPTFTKEEGIVKTFSASTNGVTVPMNFWFKINSLPNGLKDSTFKWELYNGTDILCSGNFSTDSISSNTNLGETDYYLGTDFVGNTTCNYTLYLWIDGNVDNNGNMAGKSFDFDLYATASGSNVKYSAAAYINSLYNNNSKTTVTHNGYTYNYVPLHNLMNDRLGATTVSLDGGNVRYYGAKPNNYVWLGDYYTSSLSFNSNGVNVTRNEGDKKLWRIIGIFDGRLKVISEAPITTTNLSWDTSANNTTGGNYGYGINQWGPSTYSDTGNDYEGADLMRLLNEEYTGTNGSFYWDKETGSVYTGRSNATTGNVSFVNTGLSSSEKSMIDTAVWHLGASNSYSGYARAQYAAERQSTNLGKNCSSGTYCNDKVVRMPTWEGKVGLMYASDYAYAVDFAKCGTTSLNSYSNASCRDNNWLVNRSRSVFTMSPYYTGSYATYLLLISSSGALTYQYASSTGAVYSVVYLKSNVLISAGNGKETSPYELTLE